MTNPATSAAVSNSLIDRVVMLQAEPQMVGIVRAVTPRDDGQVLCTVQITDTKGLKHKVKGEMVCHLATSLIVVG